MLEPGIIVADKYRIERVLGKGGMGTVYAARHVQLGTAIALKFLHLAMITERKVVERFEREARASARLKNEHICRVSDVGTFDGVPYIVLELLEGIDLAKLVRREGRLGVTRACDYVLQACAGIAEAHAIGIVHRDLKPGNLFLTARPDGSPLLKVLDFGIAKAPASEQGFDLTATAAVIGSPGYMSPEQLRSSKVVDERADIWALGTILFELLTGHPPFVADSLTELALKIAMDPSPHLPGDVPELDAVIARCLEKDAAARFANVGELAEALAPFGSTDPRHAASVVKGVLGAPEHPTTRMAAARAPEPAALTAVTVGDTPSTTPTSAVTQRSEPGATRRARWPLVLGVAAVVAVIGGLVIGAGGRPSPAIAASDAAPVVAAPVVDAAAPAATPDATIVTAAPVDAAPPDAGPALVVAKPVIKPPTKRPRAPVHRGSAAEPASEIDPFGELRR